MLTHRRIHNDSQVISHANNRLNARLVCLIAILNDLSYFFFTNFLSWKNSFLIIVFEYLFKVSTYSFGKKKIHILGLFLNSSMYIIGNLLGISEIVQVSYLITMDFWGQWVARLCKKYYFYSYRYYLLMYLHVWTIDICTMSCKIVQKVLLLYILHTYWCTCLDIWQL